MLFRSELLMSRESVMRRADTLGHQMVAFGKPLSTESILARYAAVEKEDVEAAARRLLAARPLVAALGPLDKLEDYAATAARLKR